MKKYVRVFALVVGVVLLFGTAAPAFAEDCTDPCPPPCTTECRSPGFWVSHPEAWPVDSITVGGISYTKAQAIALMNRTGEDKSITLFRALVSVKLDLLIGCAAGDIGQWVAWADLWFQYYAAPGSGVAAKSYAWKQGEPLYLQLQLFYTPPVCVEPVVVY